MSAEKRAAIHEYVDQFLDRETLRQPDIDTMITYVLDEPKFEATTDLVPTEEVERRLEAIADLQKFIRLHPMFGEKWCFKAVELSLLMLIPIATLQGFVSSLKQSIISPMQVVESVAIVKLLKQFLTVSGLQFDEKAVEITSDLKVVGGKASKDDNVAKGSMQPLKPVKPSRKRKLQATDQATTTRTTDGPSNHSLDERAVEEDMGETSSKQARADLDTDVGSNRRKKGEKVAVSRSQTQRTACLERDGGLCLFTGTANPEVCHIIPFSFNSSQTTMVKTIDGMPPCHLFFEYHDATELYRLLATDLGASDKHWNMVSLSSQLHTWWGMGLMALKCLGITPGPEESVIRIQFRWMHRVGRKPMERIDAADARVLVDALREPSRCGTVSAAIAISSRKVLSGDYIEIRMKHDDAVKMKLMLDLQWALAGIAAMSGAPGNPELLGDDEEPDADLFSARLEFYDQPLRGEDHDQKFWVDQWLNSLPGTWHPPIPPERFRVLKQGQLSPGDGELADVPGNIPRPPMDP